MRFKQLKAARPLTNLNEQQEKIYAILIELLAYEPKPFYINRAAMKLPYSLLVSPGKGVALLQKNKYGMAGIPPAREKQLKKALYIPKDSQTPAIAALESTSHNLTVSKAIATESAMMRQFSSDATIPSLISGRYSANGHTEAQEHMIMPRFDLTDVGEIIKDPDADLRFIDEFNFMQTIVQGLNEIHLKGFVHGDLKLENIFAHTGQMGQYGLQFAIGDFEHAHKVAAPGQFRRLYIYGTPALTAPEVFALGRINEQAAEIWAAGKTCFEFFFPESSEEYDVYIKELFDRRLLSQLAPARVTTIRQVQERSSQLLRHCDREISRLSQTLSFEHATKIKWLQLVKRMMDQNPANRPTAAQLVREMQSSPASPSAPPAPQQSSLLPSTEYIQTSTLQALHQQQNLTSHQKKLVFCALAEVLSSIHQRGLYYGNIGQHSINIAIDRQRRAKVILPPVSTGAQPTLRQYGSIHMTAPDVLRNGLQHPQAADVWACGKVFLEVLFGDSVCDQYDRFVQTHAGALLGGNPEALRQLDHCILAMPSKIIEALGSTLNATLPDEEHKRVELKSLTTLIIKMLIPHPAIRPTIQTVVNELKAILTQ